MSTREPHQVKLITIVTMLYASALLSSKCNQCKDIFSCVQANIGEFGRFVFVNV